MDLESRFYAKLLSTSNSSMIVVGGQTMAFNKGAPQTLNLVQELTLDNKSKQWTSKYKAPMKLSRANFAAVKLGKGILVSGGNNKELGTNNSCEYFINEVWSEYPAMQVRRQAHSMCLFNGFIYAFGGIDESNKQLSSIERINTADIKQGW
jgi:hypothetical protein